jgi:hypothetical protein
VHNAHLGTFALFVFDDPLTAFFLLSFSVKCACTLLCLVVFSFSVWLALLCCGVPALHERAGREEARRRETLRQVARHLATLSLTHNTPAFSPCVCTVFTLLDQKLNETAFFWRTRAHTHTHTHTLAYVCVREHSEGSDAPPPLMVFLLVVDNRRCMGPIVVLSKEEGGGKKMKGGAWCFLFHSPTLLLGGFGTAEGQLPRRHVFLQRGEFSSSLTPSFSLHLLPSCAETTKGYVRNTYWHSQTSTPRLRRTGHFLFSTSPSTHLHLSPSSPQKKKKKEE